MRATKYIGAAAAILALQALMVQGAIAQDGSFLINGETKIITKVKAPEGSPIDEIISGWEFREPTTQALEQDDFENPSFLSVDEGKALWSTVDGSEGKSCQSCHDKAEDSMKGVRAAMPKWNEAKGKPQALEHAINTCRTERMGAKAWKWESNQMLGMTAYVGLQSRGMPVNVQTDGPMKEWWERGKELYYTRVRQLDMACSHCHEDNYGKMIRADRLSQGHINGFPLYRFKSQKIGSTHHRFKGCMENIRADPYERGSDEFTALELYVASRGAGLSVETPAVRN